MKPLDAKRFHRMYGEQKARMSYERRDFLDYVLGMVLTALVAAVAYGLKSPLALLGAVLCALEVGIFPIRHGMAFKTPLILRRPQDVLYTVVYRLQNLKPWYFIALALLLLENYLIYLTPSWPHHTELMRQIALGLFYFHFISISLYRTGILFSHLRRKEHVREFLLQTTWKNVVERRSGITLEILHAYFTGLLAHLILIAPWYVVITHVQFSILVLPAGLVMTLLIQHRFLKVLNEWFYRDHWLCHNSELEFIYLHGPHHDAIPSGLLGVSGNGHLEGFLRHSLGAPGPFYNPITTFLVYGFELMNDISGHQFIPGVFPYVKREFQEINQHSTHHFGRFEPYSFGVKLDQPGIAEKIRKAVRLFPEELQNSVQLDERLTGFEWATPRYHRYLDLFEKYQEKDMTSTPKRRILKYGAVAVLSLAAAAAVAQTIWVRSGSNRWQLEMDQNGVQIYSMKSPGERVKKYKSVLQVKATLSAVVKMLEDPDVCGDVGCRESKVRMVDDQLSYHSFVIDPPFPFRSREFVAKQYLSVDPRTKSLIVEYSAAPDKMPPNDCCIRVTHMHNTWRFTPLDDGKLDIEYVVDVDEGGAIPGFVLDSTRVPFLRNALFKLEGLLNRPQYQNAQYPFLAAAS